VAGEPVKIGDVTFVVLSMMSVGMGAGGGAGEGFAEGKKGKSSPGAGTGEGAGGAGKVRPVAVVAFTADGVEVLSIPGHPDVIDKVVERVPNVVEMVEKAKRAMDHPAS
jgi:uncharacterized spore protein YtfJ